MTQQAQHHKLYAPISREGHFYFENLAQKRSRVFISPSDKKYGNVAVGTVLMIPLDAAPDAYVTPQHGVQEMVAWIWRNEDGSFWEDTLSRTAEEARSWASMVERLEALGSKVIAVRLVTKAAYNEEQSACPV